jgi:DUF1365 family protein
MGLRPHFRRVARLYDAVVMHARLWPKAHRFTHTAFACAVEPVEFKELGRGRWLLGRRWSPYAFRDQDFLPAAPLFQPEGTPQAFGASPADLEARVRAFCAAQGEPLPPEARVTLVAMPRAFGKSYNPASFLLVTVGGELRCGIAEVHNTFGERKAWFLGAACRQVDDAGRPCLRLRTPKRFYVSPFSGLDTEFEFTLRLQAQPHLHAAQRIGTEPNGLQLMLLTEVFQVGATPMSDVMGWPLTRLERPPTIQPLPVRHRNHQMPARSHQSSRVPKERDRIRNVLHHLEGGHQ